MLWIDVNKGLTVCFLSKYIDNILATDSADKLTSVDKLKFDKKVNLASLKSDVDKSDIDKLENMLSSLNSLKTKVDKLHIDRLKPFLVDLITLSNVVEEEVIKKTVFEFLLNRLMNWLKKLMLLMLVNLTKRIIMLRSKILKINT